MTLQLAERVQQIQRPAGRPTAVCAVAYTNNSGYSGNKPIWRRKAILTMHPNPGASKARKASLAPPLVPTCVCGGALGVHAPGAEQQASGA